ncbi:integration host factor subunit beta [Pedobacter sp. ISL-68]|uniref:HU family DNA-binding protein n=1 Tax=unclassified Pedobacter TaxID=2628915 RepID=UPI001BE6E9B3|nr:MULTISPECIES: HU family DNA-binding protein [unclassified Pedobacter]MBT2560097.1 integration host factor subunit beta [Pedobacter sp. ISL-64]MBT2589076.1 integration host factor subunit beta [Pedobacter sp. ISL-68]
MTKSDIVIQITTKTGIDRAEVSQILEVFFKAIKNNLTDGEAVYVRGFGSFTVKKRAAKTGRNISKNTAVQIPEHYIPSFKPSKEFVARVKTNLSKEVV